MVMEMRSNHEVQKRTTDNRFCLIQQILIENMFLNTNGLQWLTFKRRYGLKVLDTHKNM